jgi:hypothetical protein
MPEFDPVMIAVLPDRFMACPLCCMREGWHAAAAKSMTDDRGQNEKNAGTRPAFSY